MAPRNGSNLRARLQALRRDLCLLLRRPSPPSLPARDYLDPAQSIASAAPLRMVLMMVLITVTIPVRTVLMIMLKLHDWDSPLLSRVSSNLQAPVGRWGARASYNQLQDQDEPPSEAVEFGLHEGR